MKHDMHYRDCSASEIDDEPNWFGRTVDTLMFVSALVLILLILVLAA